MAKKLLRLVFVLSYLLYSAFTLYCLANLLSYNEILMPFMFAEKAPTMYQVDTCKSKRTCIHYSYIVDQKAYENEVVVYDKLYNEQVDKKNVKIAYNTAFPSVSYIRPIKLVNGYYFGLFFGLFLLTGLSLIDRFADKDKWIRRYQGAFTSNRE